MAESKLKTRDCLHILSLLALGSTEAHARGFESCRNLDEADSAKLLRLARDHHVTVRVCNALKDFAAGHTLPCPAWITTTLAVETSQIEQDLPLLAGICRRIEQAGFNAVIIKSLDHWPDVGSDFDIYVAAPPDKIQLLMQCEFNARLQRQGWVDRLACKWNFAIPGLNKLVEIHAGRLGQTGQQVRLGRDLVARSVTKIIDGNNFRVPCAEDQLLLAVLDCFYRRYYLRICEVINTAHLVLHEKLDFESVRRESKRAGIRRGLAAYLAIIAQYYAHYSGQQLPLPPRILKHASFGMDKIYANAGFLRVPLFPQSASLYTRELAKAIRRKDIKKTARISLLPGLAVAAGAKFRITGKDKGIW